MSFQSSYFNEDYGTDATDQSGYFLPDGEFATHFDETGYNVNETLSTTPWGSVTDFDFNTWVDKTDVIGGPSFTLSNEHDVGTYGQIQVSQDGFGDTVTYVENEKTTFDQVSAAGNGSDTSITHTVVDDVQQTFDSSPGESLQTLVESHAEETLMSSWNAQGARSYDDHSVVTHTTVTDSHGTDIGMPFSGGKG